MRQIKTLEEIQILQKGGTILARILKTLSKEVSPGVSTQMLEDKARKLIDEAGAVSAFLNYTPHGAKRAYPAVLCVSVNDEVVHGIPNENPKILKEGDLVSLDCGISFEGMFTDSAITVIVGKGTEKNKKLLIATREALDKAIAVCVPGNTTGDVGRTISEVAKKYGFTPVKGLGGHGVGFSPHEDPFIPNEKVSWAKDVFKEGMVVAIEPMLATGGGKVRLLKDGYTYATADGGISSHMEHTIAIRAKSPLILTA